MGDNGMPPEVLMNTGKLPYIEQTWGFSKIATLWKSPEPLYLQFVAAVSGRKLPAEYRTERDGEIPED